MQEYGRFVFLGITGAIFANSTGAGGGVIFIPVFSSLNFSESQSVSTSFMIQCFGMTAGAISWSLHYKKHHREDDAWSGFVKASLLAAFFSVLGFWSSQLLQLNSPSSLHTSFSIFSIVLGIAIIISSKSSTQITRSIMPVDFLWLALIGYFGGIITAWLSVGVGELVVIYLMIRGLCAKMAVATGVVVSAITVWSASPIHIFPTNSHALFELVLFAGPGAIIGGLLARKLALFLPVKVLKLFFSIWIILTGSVMLAS
ncbi:sulfite exporter TauE/SafE family protein [Shewanella sp. NKUCC01_JLK]|uniref:sulfite exporter TauE/SafE family protein n=1 Tax=Shewanella sp. NKUCC01_JLK TaxID=2842123 RepID=UPI003211C351